METPSHVAALVTKRDEVSARIREAQTEIRLLTADLDTIEKAIRVFDPNALMVPDVPRPVAPLNLSARGATIRTILKILDGAEGTMATDDIAKQLMLDQGIDLQDARAYYLMTRRVGACLRTLSGRGIVKSVFTRKGEFCRWEAVKGNP